MLYLFFDSVNYLENLYQVMLYLFFDSVNYLESLYQVMLYLFFDIASLESLYQVTGPVSTELVAFGFGDCLAASQHGVCLEGFHTVVDFSSVLSGTDSCS